ncbi:MAG: iron-containing alcohol dehydrogenase [Clostridia bacterium]|nr:iron-containing alcohol dehydrogenase [Clostridia bacterium]
MTDNRLAKMPISNWGGLGFKCRCGNLHEINVKEFVIQQGACDHTAHFAKKMGKTMHLVFEQKVFEKTKDKVVKKFGKIFDVTTSIIKEQNLFSIEQCEQIFAQAKEQTKVIVCVGGYNACQYGKYASQKLGVQWIFINVLPDCDDVATNYCTLWKNKVKQILPGKSPDVVLCDTALAYDFCLDDLQTAFAVVLQNGLFAFDRVFANKVQNAKNCDVANYLLATSVKNAINLAKKPFSKNTVSELFACQYLISVAKCLSVANQNNFAGIHAFTNALQSKYPHYTFGQVVCVANDVLSKIYAQVVENNCLLTIDKDRFLHETLALKKFGVQVNPVFNFETNDKAFEQNVEFFKQNLALIAKINNLCKSMIKQSISWQSKVAFDCLQLCTDIYPFNGLLRYANDKGYFDKQND